MAYFKDVPNAEVFNGKIVELREIAKGRLKSLTRVEC